METPLIQKARLAAQTVFADKKFDAHPYHNIEHTREVVEAAIEIGKQCNLNETELEAVTLAAWLHDIGYINTAAGHEAAAAAQAKEWLTQWGAQVNTITYVVEAILATKVPQQPNSLVSEVLCDADMYHFALPNFHDRGELLRKEWDLGGKSMSDAEWRKDCIDFMQRHRYHTPYGKEVLEVKKQKNIKKLMKEDKPEGQEKKLHKLEEEVTKLRSKLEQAKTMKPDRGIETMFRLTSTNHLMLSSMADTKANIMISINAIILSVVVSVLVRKLEEEPRLFIPTILLVASCLATIVFAILATRPNVSSGTFSRDDISNKRTNLLFFGNFHGMDIKDYEWAMKEMMKDADYLYGSLIKDIYYLGKVLGRKYKLLRISYNIFMFGFVLSVLSFLVALLM